MIDAATCAIERAICDKAQAYAAQFVQRNGWTVLTAEQAAHPDYAACDNAMRGRVEQYELLTATPERFVAYIAAEQTREQVDATNYVACRRWHITTWAGDVLGTVVLGSGWRVNSCFGPRMYQATAWVNGREFTGRTFGAGMCISLRETAASKRKRDRK